LEGLAMPDRFQRVCFQHLDLTGRITGQSQGFKRVITSDLGVIKDITLQKFILNFLKSDIRYISSDSFSASVALLTPKDFKAERINQSIFGKRFILELLEEQVHSLFPSPSDSEDHMQLKLKVQITGTKSSPQTIITGSGSLGANDSSNTPWGVFDDSLYIYHIDVNGTPYQEATVNLVDNIYTIVSGNLQCQIAVSSGGSPATDGNFYADVAIYREVRS
jgi:hypothetical protein